MPIFIFIKVKLLALWAWLKIKFAVSWWFFTKVVFAALKKLTWVQWMSLAWTLFSITAYVVNRLQSSSPKPTPSPSPEKKSPIEKKNPIVCLGEIPYHVSIQYKLEYNEVKHRCSGTLIDQKHILTTGSCFINCNEVLNSAGYISKWKVVVGTRSIPHGTAFEVSKIARHPEYDPNDKSNDIAVIRLMQNIGKVAYTGSIRLPSREENIKTGDELFVSGFGSGALKEGNLKKFNARVSNETICKQHYSSLDLNGKFCATVMPDHYAGSGGSGSPATVNKDFVIGIWLQYNGPGPHNKFPEIYTTVTYYLDFIKTVTA